MRNSFLYLEEDLEQDNGHFSVLVQRKVVFCQWRYSTRWMGQNGWKDDGNTNRKRTPSLSSHENPLSRGQLKSKGGGKLSIHYCADQDTITTVFRTIISVNQLSLYGAVAEMCEEFESFDDRTGKPVVGGQSSSSFLPSVIKTNVPMNSDDHDHKDLLLQ